MQIRLFWALLLLALPALAAERAFNFGEMSEGQPPAGFRSTVSGKGKPGDWKIVLDAVPSMMQPLTPQAPSVSSRAVLAQLAQDPTDEHFPLLVFDDETYGDFTFTTRFKTVRGVMEQMAGIAFRIQNETNYYVVRASSLGNTFRFYKVVDGQRGTIIGPEISIPSGVWHEMSVDCKGNQIRCSLDGKELIPMLIDSSFSRGKIGFWTKSDSVSYFTDAKIVYTPLENLAQTMVRSLSQKYSRLLDLKIYVAGTATNSTRLVASKDEKNLGQPGGKAELDVIARGIPYYGKTRDSVAVTLPLRDRNGDPIAAVRVVMKTFAGQTEANAVVRALPIVKEMERRVPSLQDLLE